MLPPDLKVLPGLLADIELTAGRRRASVSLPVTDQCPSAEC